MKKGRHRNVKKKNKGWHHFLPVAHICSNQIMGWGEKAIEIRSVETGHLDGVFMHKRAQRLKFLCERNDKVRLIALLATAGVKRHWQCMCCSAGVLCICAVRGQQSGVLHDPEQELHHELVKEQSGGQGAFRKSQTHAEQWKKGLSVTYSHTQNPLRWTHSHCRIPVPTEASHNAVPSITDKSLMSFKC